MGNDEGSPRRESNRTPYVWLAIAAVLLVFTYGMYRNPLAALLAPVFLLRFIRTQPVGRGYLLVLLTLIVTNTISWWNTGYELPAVGRVVFGAFVGLLYSVAYLLDRVLVRRFAGFAATLVFPLAYTASEFLSIWPTPVSTYGSLEYSQFASTYLIQIASITGLWGVTFVMCWFASVANWVWETNLNWPTIRRGVAIYAGTMLVVLLFGMVRLGVSQAQPGSVRVHGIVETDYTSEQWSREVGPLVTTDPAAVKANVAPSYDRYLNATIREARAGAEMVVWPELATVGYKDDIAALLERARTVARQEGIYLAMGVGLLSTDSAYVQENRLVVLDPQGNTVVNQLKYGCMPAQGLYGAQIQTVDTPFGRVAGVICCDADFPYVVRQASQQGVDILLVPSFEPTPENITAHSQMVQFRAIENGVSIFRPTIQGLSQAIDPLGQTLASMDATRTDQRVLVVQLPNHRVPTVYGVVNDGFGWLAVVGFAVIVAVAIARGRGEAATPSAT